MDFREGADRVVAFCQNTVHCHMIAFFINIFSVSTLRTISDNAKSLEFIAVRLYKITVINVGNRLVRNLLADNREVIQFCLYSDVW